ncbi:MAG TPA: hypothetical protein VHM91_13845, partial [Verrucomicrobiales bacterium]|nr:hypothetical protein [Verrucomicrobiales bacterium]
PSKNHDHPYDPVLTGHVTAALDDLNAQLSALARVRGIGFADIYGRTKELLTSDRTCIGGWVVTKRSSGDGDSDAMFLDDGFHPNTPLQAIFAQIILDTFNNRYGTSLPRLANREIVNKCLDENPDVTFTQWTTNYGIAAADRGALADPDRDGVPNIVEYGLDLDPIRVDSNLLPKPVIITQSGQSYLTLTWQPRDPANTAHCEITPQQSSDLLTWTDVPAASVTSASLNVRTVSVPFDAAHPVWLRLKVRQIGL